MEEEYVTIQKKEYDELIALKQELENERENRIEELKAKQRMLYQEMQNNMVLSKIPRQNFYGIPLI